MSATETPAETPAGPTPQAAYPPPRRLARTPDDKMLGGVCGGIARYANVDATLIRVLAVLLGVVVFPFSIVAYLVIWAVMPASDILDR